MHATCNAKGGSHIYSQSLLIALKLSVERVAPVRGQYASSANITDDLWLMKTVSA